MHKPINGKYERRQVNSPFTDNIWGADLAGNWKVNLIKDLDFCYVSFTFIANMHGLFLQKIKRHYNY